MGKLMLGKKDAIIPKQKLIIFDLDGCIADSDNFVITNEEAWKLDKSLFKEKPTRILLFFYILRISIILSSHFSKNISS